jgi:hypothetical protein
MFSNRNDRWLSALHVHVVLLLTAELLVRRTVTGDEVDVIMRRRYRNERGQRAPASSGLGASLRRIICQAQFTQINESFDLIWASRIYRTLKHLKSPSVLAVRSRIRTKRIR